MNGSKPQRECKNNWTLHDNHISPKQPKIVNKESKLYYIGRNDHDKCTQKKQCSERWDIKRNVKCRPNIHISTTTLMRVNTSVETRRRERYDHSQIHKQDKGL